MPAAEADRPGKVFVGGLASDIDEAVLEKYFSHYGRLTEGNYSISVKFNSGEKNLPALLKGIIYWFGNIFGRTHSLNLKRVLSNLYFKFLRHLYLKHFKL